MKHVERFSPLHARSTLTYLYSVKVHLTCMFICLPVGGGGGEDSTYKHCCVNISTVYIFLTAGMLPRQRSTSIHITYTRKCFPPHKWSPVVWVDFLHQNVYNTNDIFKKKKNTPANANKFLGVFQKVRNKYFKIKLKIFSKLIFKG